MIYFCCTSMFQVFVILFILKTEYALTSKKKVLILLDHVESLMLIKDNLIKSNLWDEVIIIHTEIATPEEIELQLDQIKFSENDIFHLIGKEYVGFSLYNRIPACAKIVLTCESIMSSFDIVYSINEFYQKDWFNGREFDFNKIDEIWSWDSTLTVNHLDIPEKYLDIIHTLAISDFKKSFIELLIDIFNIKDLYENNSLIYFDTYLLTGQNLISDDLERFLLNEICNALGEFGLKIKKHPGERNIEKYSNLNSAVLDNSYIPWEVLRLIELDKNKLEEKYIYLTYASTALFNERWLFNNYDSHLIFLNKILSRYSDKTLSNNDFMIRFIEIYGDKNIYLPESFTELKEIVWNIKNSVNTAFEFSTMYKEEQERVSNWFINEYKKNWNTVPPVYNITSLLLDYGEGFIEAVAENITINDKKEFIFKFLIPEDKRKAIKQLRWYAVRGRAVKIKLNQIEIGNKDKFQMIDISIVNYEGNKNKYGYIEFQSFDPCIEIPFTGDVEEVSIKGEWIFDNRYREILELSNKMGEKYADIIKGQEIAIKQLLQDIDGRDISIKQLLQDIDNRDTLIKQLLKDIDGRDILIKQMMTDIKDREKNIDILLIDMNNKDELIKKNLKEATESLEEKDNIIKNQEKELVCFRNSRYWKLKSKFLKKKIKR